MIGASHSHSSGPTGMILPGEFDHASELVQLLAYERSSCANAEYLERVPTKSSRPCARPTRAGPSALRRRHEDKVAFNRRFRMKNGLT